MENQNPEAIFEAGAQSHRAGKLAEAEQHYRRVLAVAPDHPQAIHHLGVLALQCGQPQVALRLIGRSIQLQPSAAGLNNYGEALRTLGRLADAETAYWKALDLDPRNVDAMANLSLVLLATDRVAEAEQLLQKAVGLAPDHVGALASTAMLYDKRKRGDDAVTLWERVVRLAPHEASFHRSLGATWLEIGDPYRAITAWRRALDLVPNDALTYMNLAAAYKKINKSDEAIATAKKAVELSPDAWRPFAELGSLYSEFDQPDLAIDAFEKALERNPTFAALHGALATALLVRGRVAESKRAFVHGVNLNPGEWRLHTGLAQAHLTQRDFAAAVQSARNAVQLNPREVETHASLAFALLAGGQFEEGFREYEWRWRDKSFTSKPRDFLQPIWDGSDPAGRTILVHTEQGSGDTFQFWRYVPMIRDAGAKVVLEAPYTVASLARRMAVDVPVYVTGTVLPKFDLHVPLLSLPAIFGTSAKTIPASVPYLSADASLADAGRAKLESVEGLRVGLVWAGNVKPDPKRSATLAELAPLAEVSGVSFISMQPPPRSQDVESAPAGFKLQNIGASLGGVWDTTATRLSQLDLLITIDTGVAHLAGAMGLKTWILLPHAADWRWVGHDSVSAWYPTARLFRQPTPGDWAAVARSVAMELNLLVARKEGSI